MVKCFRPFDKFWLKPATIVSGELRDDLRLEIRYKRERGVKSRYITDDNASSLRFAQSHEGLFE
ncbi:unnamed protein product, partial [Gordionus sp. m RMFG-2023]